MLAYYVLVSPQPKEDEKKFLPPSHCPIAERHYNPQQIGSQDSNGTDTKQDEGEQQLTPATGPLIRVKISSGQCGP